MSTTKRFGRLQRAAAIVPLALLSAAWTASLVSAGATAGSSADPDDVSLPDGASVPTEAIEAPASVSSGDDLGLGASGDTQQIIDTSTTNSIPSAALAAYQRAETVINSADKSCNLTWQLIAAIGRVESNHGRFGGNTLDDSGVAEPGIYGIALNGKNNTSVIRDTDAGLFDNDAVFDRAVGPMQFIPSTWSVVGVDADGDGERNPQDIDDSALATAVYLCSGDDDLSTTAGQRAAVYRYNHSQSYVDLVLSIMNAYLDGDFTSIPNNTTAAGLLIPEPPSSTNNGTGDGGPRPGADNGGGTSDPGGTTDPGTDPGDNDGGGDNGGGDNGGGDGGDPTDPPPALPPVTVPPLPSTGADPVDEVLTLAEAVVQCTLDGVSQLNLNQWNSCLDRYMNP